MEKCIWNSINKNVNKFMPKTKSKQKKKQSKCFLFILFNLIPAILTYNLMISFRFVQGADSGTTRGGLDDLSPSIAS